MAITAATTFENLKGFIKPDLAKPYFASSTPCFCGAAARPASTVGC